MIFQSSVYTVIPSVFENLDISINDIFKLIDFQIENNVRDIVLLGTTSETPTLSTEEQDKIVTEVWDKYNDKINIIVGIGGNNTKNTLENAFKFRDKCHAYMATVPYYNKPTQEGIYQHFSTIAQLIEDKPIMLYNIPSRCGVSMSSNVVVNLYNSFDNIKAIKEASGDFQHILEIKNNCDIIILSGDDNLTLPLLSIGCKGVVSVASNIIPSEMLQLCSYYNEGKVIEASELNKKLYPIFKNLFIETNPTPLKYLLYRLNLISNCSVRLPLVPISNLEVRNSLDGIHNLIQQNKNSLNLNC